MVLANISQLLYAVLIKLNCPLHFYSENNDVLRFKDIITIFMIRTQDLNIDPYEFMGRKVFVNRKHDENERKRITN